MTSVDPERDPVAETPEGPTIYRFPELLAMFDEARTQVLAERRRAEFHVVDTTSELHRR